MHIDYDDNKYQQKNRGQMKLGEIPGVCTGSKAFKNIKKFWCTNTLGVGKM